MNSSHEANLPGVLVIEDREHPDGIAFTGTLFGAAVTGDSILAAQKTTGLARDRGYGEVVFNTSLTGYQEILTDPSYYGQIICMTVPHIGNTGVNTDDPESAHPWCAGFVVHEISETASSWRSLSELDAYLKEAGIPGLHGIDTRALTRHLRSSGVVRGVVLPAAERNRAKELLAALPAFEGRDLIGEVTTKETYLWPHPKASLQKSTKIGERVVPTFNGESAAPKKRHKVVVLDFGTKWNLLRSLHALGCDLEVVPATTSAKEILARKPDGVFLTNGPGDPAAAPYASATVREMVGKVPLFGVCMGHQILSLAQGAKTYKMKFGHRGGNQPVLEIASGRVEITSQNHGYAVEEKTLPAGMSVTHRHLNDQTVAGVDVTGARAFSVQYHPESCPGPHDSRVLFDRFIALMEGI
ncbi:MAG: glutamine-hydrolyzing carbamoyl-phosphate synthase small subunit [Cryobacterium sp.]|nr:glutamine-hydrolyzing carbamoyl-phosphate synthase small subunit [Oligoflexia bacterium]